MIKKTVFLILGLILIFSVLYGEKGLSNKNDELQIIKKNAPKVYIDCDYCDMDFIRTNIVFVNYVVDTHEADIYILITRLRTGSRGRKYTLKFTGQKKFKGINDELYYISNHDDTEDTIRKGIVEKLKLGLIQYIKNSKIADYINILFTEKIKKKEVKNKWNNWIFNVSGGFSLGGEKSYKSKSFNYSASASRVTEQSRIQINFFKYIRTSTYKMEDEKLKSEKKRTKVSGIYVGSINEHFSFGGRFDMGSSTYYNRKRQIKLAPAIEYDFFPYSEATSKILRINYSIGIEADDYFETTIYNKDKETLVYQALLGELEIKERWGDASISIEFSQYLYDMKKYSLQFSGDVSWRILKGISFYSYGSYSLIHNQLYLPKGDLSSEEILLRTSALETNYDYYLGAGIRISFGSIYNNAVNPRFGY